MKVLLGPHVSEKSTRVGELNNQVVFRVARDADKPVIKQAVEHLFEVKVESVNIVNVKGKRKRFEQIAGRRGDWKKAYVRLAPGEDIDFLGNE